MAELIQQARAARAEAMRLRHETLSLKLTLRESARYSREQLHSAELAHRRVHARRDEPLPSAWSPLLWTCEPGELASVLVPVS